MRTTRYRIGRRRMKYRVNRRRLYPILSLFIIFVVLMILTKVQEVGFHSKVTIGEFKDEHLLLYFDAGAAQDVPWYYLAAIDRAERIEPEDINRQRAEAIALHLRGITSDKELKTKLQDYNEDKKFIKRIEDELKCLQYIIKVYYDKVFPVAHGKYYYEDGFGDDRTYGGERSHEGIDIMCDEGTPLLSVCDGRIEKKGWLELGGWRLGIRGNDGVYYYYAHMSRYQDRLEEGDKVKKGQVIGYVGDTGYGEEGTTGEFDPHLHFGMYERDGFGGRGERAINPYPFLTAWERDSN